MPQPEPPETDPELEQTIRDLIDRMNAATEDSPSIASWCVSSPVW
jgi:beta-galactosidase/beta-glucuronidase